MLKLSRKEWDVIEDALLHRAREAQKLAVELNDARLSKQFQSIADAAEKVLNKLEQSGDI